MSEEGNSSAIKTGPYACSVPVHCSHDTQGSRLPFHRPQPWILDATYALQCSHLLSHGVPVVSQALICQDKPVFLPLRERKINIQLPCKHTQRPSLTPAESRHPGEYS